MGKLVSVVAGNWIFLIVLISLNPPLLGLVPFMHSKGFTWYGWAALGYAGISFTLFTILGCYIGRKGENVK